jgi:hypothetical protein
MIKQLVLSTTLATLLATSLSSNAQSCKGLPEASCTSQPNACYWVDGYKRSDDVEVKAHCRTKAKKKSVSDAAKTSTQNKNSTEKAKVTSAKEPTKKAS